MLLSINERDNRPIYQQLVGQIKEQVSRSILKPGDELPSVRELSDSLGINMHTVRRAYLELRDQGIIILRLGRKAKISSGKPNLGQSDAAESIRTRLRESVTDAVLSGFSPEEIKKIVNKQLE